MHSRKQLKQMERARSRRWEAPPPVGSKMVVRRAVGHRVFGEVGRPSKTGHLGAGTEVKVVRHTPGCAHYGPGCEVTPTNPRHKWFREGFYISNDELQHLSKR